MAAFLLAYFLFLFICCLLQLSLSHFLSLSPPLSFKVSASSAQILTLSLRDGGKVSVILYRKYELMEDEVFNILAYSLITLL